MSKVRISFNHSDSGFPEASELIHHVSSRIMMDLPLITATARDEFLRQMKIGKRFTGVRVVSYVIRPDHFHLVVAVSAKQEETLDEKEFFKRVGPTLERRALAELKVAWKSAKPSERKELQKPFLERMNQLSEFMRNLVQRMTRFINRERGSKGTLWQSRYRSSIIEEGFTTRAVCAYLHTNPVRSGLVDDPADYEWSSFTKARKADRALAMRASLFALQRRKPVPRKAIKILESEISDLNPKFSDQDLALAEAVSQTIRHFIDGLIVGSEDFVNRIFEANRGYFSEGRTSGARRPMGPLKLLKGEIQTARDLQHGVYQRKS
ncbi:MAG: REP element-mobilizing transposase RayT [Akkermansiaceae bacterium]|jgi:putative transposase